MDIYGQRGVLVRLIYLSMAAVCWLCTGFGCLGRRRAVVLCYHGVTSEQQERFAWQAQRVAERTIGVSELASLGNERGGLPRISFTFDDGFASLLQNVLPVMRGLGIPATLFLVAGNLGKKPRWPMTAHPFDTDTDLMTADEILAASRDGTCRIGSHTLAHPDLVKITSSSVRQELSASKLALEHILDDEIIDFALPYGSYNDQIIGMAKAAGYKRVFTVDACMYPSSKADDVIGRFLMSPDVWRSEFVLTCAGAYSFLHPWRRCLRSVRHVLETCTLARAVIVMNDLGID